MSLCSELGSGLRSRAPLWNSQLSCRPEAAPRLCSLLVASRPVVPYSPAVEGEEVLAKHALLASRLGESSGFWMDASASNSVGSLR